MNGWQEPKDGKRIYIITDNTKMNGFIDYDDECKQHWNNLASSR